MSGLRLIWLGGAALLAGCGLESPQSPSFETIFNVPLEEQRYSGAELAAGLAAIEGDSAEPGPLSVRIAQAFEPVYLDDHIKITVAETRHAATLEEIAYTPPAIPPVAYRADDLLPAAVPLGEPVVFEACALQPDPVDLGTFTDFDEVVFSAGTLLITLNNGFPVALESVTLLVEDDEERTIARWDHGGSLAAQGEADGAVDLAGIEMGHVLSLTLSGTLAGSGPEPVTLSPDAGIAVDLHFHGVQVSSLSGPLPNLSLETEVAIDLDERISIEQATVAAGELALTVTSGLPIDVTLALSAPDLLIGSTPLAADLALPSGGTGTLVIDFADEILTVAGADPWHWDVGVSGEGSGQAGTVNLDQGIEVVVSGGDLRFTTLRGRVDQLSIELPGAESAIEFPEGTEGVDFAAVDAEIILRNRVGVPAVAELELIGSRDADSVRVPFTVELQAGSAEVPASASALLTESNSDILELLALRPTQVTVAGQVRVGDGTTTAEITAGDYLDGEFQLLAPMKLVLETARQEGEPFAVELDEELREQVTEKLVAITILAQVENHFPTGVDLTFHFAKIADALFVNDDLTLSGEVIASAEVDAGSGRVTEATQSEVTLNVAAGDLRLFAEEQLFGGLEVVLQGDGETPVEIWSSDYVRIQGIATFRYRVE